MTGGAHTADTVRTYLHGCAFPSSDGVPYPRLDMAASQAIAADTLRRARVPAGVRLELNGTIDAIRIEYESLGEEIALPGAPSGREFALWQHDRCLDRVSAELDGGEVELVARDRTSDRLWVYLPEALRPNLLDVVVAGRSVEAPLARPKVLMYGDSIVEGFSASEPARSWSAVVGRRWGLDVYNFGYAGSARGELAVIEQIASLPAHAIVVAFGTNCWHVVPHTARLMAATVNSALITLRRGHPSTPIIWVSPIVRPAAEDVPNRAGAALADLRQAMEATVREWIERGDATLVLVEGAGLVPVARLVDGIHPDDVGHEMLANAIGRRLAEVLSLPGA